MAEKAFQKLQKIQNVVYDRPALSSGIPGWVIAQLGKPIRLYRDTIWNRYAYNRDGRMTNRAALQTLGGTLVMIIVVIWSILAFL